MYALYCRLNVSVYTPPREVIRRLRARLTPNSLSRAKRADRHRLYRSILREHDKALRLVVQFRL